MQRYERRTTEVSNGRYAGKRAAKRYQARIGAAQTVKLAAGGDDRPGLHHRHRTFSGQRHQRKTCGPSGDFELRGRRGDRAIGDVGAGGNGGGASGCWLLWTVRGNVSASVGGVRGAVHLL